MTTYAALVSLMNTMDHIQNHPRLSNSLDKNQIKSLSEKIGFLLDFIENGCPGVISKEAQDLESQIASAAHEAEDVIESHVVDQIHAASVSLFDLHTVLQDMDHVKEKVVKFKGETIFKDALAKYPISATSSTPLTGRQKSKMVGFDEELIPVMDALTGQQSSLQIIRFVGMGGSGKTTLARNVYEKPLILQHFDIRGWVTISQNYHVGEIYSKLLSTDQLDGQTEDQLAHKLYQRLIGRRYLIILDDMWSIEVWEKIRFFFPDDNNGSRIVITTRLSNLASHFGSDNQFSMKFLDKDKSWNLFCESVFTQEGCPPGLEEIGKKIVEKCKGLPLMIVVIGGLLRKSSMTQEHWENISKDINSIFDNIGEEYKKNLDVLSLSYNHLPAHLKPCFLYMGIFPEDHEVDVSQLIRLWVAEGFVKPNKTQSPEEVSYCYLKDLIDRNLILVRRSSPVGEVSTVGVHDLLRDLCVKTGENEKFLHVVRASDDVIRGGIDKERRIVFHEEIPVEKHEHPILSGALESASLTRSLVGNKGGELIPSKSKLLRVSYLVDSSVKDNFMLVNLRYIGTPFSRGGLELVPSHISLLWNLQTLDVDIIAHVVAPPEIWEMPSLRHVKFPIIRLPDPPLSDPKDDSVALWNLQTLKTVNNFAWSDEVCKRIPNVKCLGISYLEYDDVEIPYDYDFCLYNIGRLHKLESLFCNAHQARIPGTQRARFMQNLAFLTSLRILGFINLSLGSEDMEIIGSLPALESLKLFGSTFSGNEWTGEFLRLKYLENRYCPGFTHWSSSTDHHEDDNSDLPVLENLVLEGAYEVDELPLAIGEYTLRSIKMTRCSLSAAISAARILEERMSLGNDDGLVVQITFDKKAEYDSFFQQITEFECVKSHNLIIGLI